MSARNFDDAVRCKDCRYAYQSFEKLVCGLFTVNVGPKQIIWEVDQLDFCSWGMEEPWNGTKSKRR